jgi:hypothetical protein
MIGPENGKLGQPRTALPPSAGGSINGTRVLMALLLFVIAIGAIMGVVVALSSGQPTVALIIGLVAAAFFARVGC